jgi:hypothetical protein
MNLLYTIVVVTALVAIGLSKDPIVMCATVVTRENKALGFAARRPISRSNAPLTDTGQDMPVQKNVHVIYECRGGC